MQYHIHGAFLQRFLSYVVPGPSTFLRAVDNVAVHVRAAAEATGATFAIEYDVSGIADATILPTLQVRCDCVCVRARVRACVCVCN